MSVRLWLLPPMNVNMNQEFKNAWKERNKSFWDNRQHNCDWITWCGGWMLYDGDLFRVKNF